jgi:MoaA/NifB/PqqE/SkfB family radical SAM enzyme
MRDSAYLQITRKCNNQCVFCSNPQFEKDYTLKEAKNRVIEFKKQGIGHLFITGGEPTIVPFLAELIKFIKEQNMDTSIITNGVNLCEKQLVTQLYNAGLRTLHVSIHSCREEIADSLAQKNGHLKKTIEGVKNCLDQKINVNVNSTINSKNCNHLSENVEFFIKRFPEIKHFVFNALDPGKADGNMKSRAGDNPWVVAKLTDMELELQKMVTILKKNNKTFRIERVPLCYMAGFEEFSTETRKIIKDEEYICSFIEENSKNQIRKVLPKQLRTKVECCKICFFNEICAGIQQEYLDIYGDKELYPIFQNPQIIKRRVLEDERTNR